MADFFGAKTTTLLGDVNTALTPVGINQMLPVANAGGRSRKWSDRITLVAASTAQNDRVLLARLPSNAVIHMDSRLEWDNIGAATAKFKIGTLNPPGKSGITDTTTTIHSAGHDISAAGSGFLFDTPTTKNGKALWELAGASSDPKQLIDIWGTFITADVDADGSMAWVINYTID